MAVLLSTGGADRQDAFDKGVALGAMRAETALPPEHRRTERLFGGSVRWFDTVFTDERPARRFMGQQFLTQAFRRITPPRPLREEAMHRLLDRHQRRLEQRSVDRPFPE